MKGTVDCKLRQGSMFNQTPEDPTNKCVVTLLVLSAIAFVKSHALLKAVLSDSASDAQARVWKKLRVASYQCNPIHDKRSTRRLRNYQIPVQAGSWQTHVHNGCTMGASNQGVVMDNIDKVLFCLQQHESS